MAEQVTSVQLVIMGPSGSGKTTIGIALAAELGLDFKDADDLHPEENVAKMRAGTPLVDDDRGPWLDLVGQEIAASQGIVMACSALTHRYRDRLRNWAPQIIFVELLVGGPELHARMRSRDHFMPPSLLDSQLKALQTLAPDERGIQVVNHGSIAAVVERAVEALEAFERS